MVHAAVLVRSLAPMPQDVRRDQPEHPQPQETERATSSTSRQRRCALTRTRVALLSEHIMRVTDVLPQHGHDQRLGAPVARRRGTRHPSQPKLVQRLLRGMRLSYKKPAKCVKELHSTGQQHANTHRLFIKLCWQMSTYGVSEDRVVNIDETSCRLFPVHQIGLGHRGVNQAQLQGNTKEATTFTVAFSVDRGPLDMLVQIVHVGNTDAVLRELPWPEHTHRVTSVSGWANTTTEEPGVDNWMVSLPCPQRCPLPKNPCQQ